MNSEYTVINWDPGVSSTASELCAIMTQLWPANGWDPKDDGLVDNPMYQQTSTTASLQAYEEIKLRGSRFDESGSGRVNTQNTIYGMGAKHSQVLQHPTTLNLDRVYNFNPREQKGGGRRECRLSWSCLMRRLYSSSLWMGMVLILIMVLSGEHARNWIWCDALCTTGRLILTHSVSRDECDTYMGI